MSLINTFPTFVFMFFVVWWVEPYDVSLPVDFFVLCDMFVRINVNPLSFRFITESLSLLKLISLQDLSESQLLFDCGVLLIIVSG